MREPRHRRIWSYGMIVGLEVLVIGIVLFLWARGVLTPTETVAYFLFGIGAILLFDVVARYLQLAPRRFMWCRLMFAFIFLASGGAVLGGIGSWWPLILIMMGVGLLANGLISLLRKEHVSSR